MTGNGHIIMAEAAEAAKRLRVALWSLYGVDPAGTHVTAGIESDGEVTLRIGVDPCVPRQPPGDLPEFEGFRCKLVPFDGTGGVQKTGNVPHRSVIDG